MEPKAFSIGPLQGSRSLTNDLVESLRSMILEGNMPAGTKLPAAKDIEEQAGVSRSVVREAVAALKAEGLIISRQGVGMFVANKVQIQSFEIDFTEFSCIEDAVKILELRMAVELEMASMAAKNRTTKQMRTIWDCLEKFDKQVASGNDAVQKISISTWLSQMHQATHILVDSSNSLVKGLFLPEKLLPIMRTLLIQMNI